MIWVAEYKPFTLVGSNNLLNSKQRRILDNNKYMKTLHNPKMLLTNDPIVSVRSDSILGASGKDYSADFIVCCGNILE
jgi:hypothetical protein